MANIVFRDPGEKPSAVRADVLDKNEAAKYLRMSLRKLEYMMSAGSVKYGKLHGAVWFRRADLDAALERIFEDKQPKPGPFTPENYS